MARLQLQDDDVRPVRGPTTGARTIDIAALYATHAPDIRRLCLRLTRDPSAAEDLAQETFTRFIARLPQLPSTVNIGAYLQVTARNLYLKSLRTGTMEVCDELLEERLGSDDDLERDPARATLLVEQIHQMRRSTSRLNGRQRRALMLREVEGRSYPEIADSMGISTDAVAHVLARARTRLRSEYRREQGPPAIAKPACGPALDMLSSYLDGQLADTDHDSVAAHLAGCRECRNVLTSYREASIQLRAAGPGSALAAMLERVGGILQGAVGNATGTAATVAGTAAIVVAGGSGVVVAHHFTAPGSQRTVAAASLPAVSATAATAGPAGGSSTAVDTWRPGSSGTDLGHVRGTRATDGSGRPADDVRPGSDDEADRDHRPDGRHASRRPAGRRAGRIANGSGGDATAHDTEGHRPGGDDAARHDPARRDTRRDDADRDRPERRAPTRHRSLDHDAGGPTANGDDPAGQAAETVRQLTPRPRS